MADLNSLALGPPDTKKRRLDPLGSESSGESSSFKIGTAFCARKGGGLGSRIKVYRKKCAGVRVGLQ